MQQAGTVASREAATSTTCTTSISAGPSARVAPALRCQDTIIGGWQDELTGLERVATAWATTRRIGPSATLPRSESVTLEDSTSSQKGAGGETGWAHQPLRPEIVGSAGAASVARCEVRWYDEGGSVPEPRT